MKNKNSRKKVYLGILIGAIILLLLTALLAQAKANTALANDDEEDATVFIDEALSALNETPDFETCQGKRPQVAKKCILSIVTDVYDICQKAENEIEFDCHAIQTCGRNARKLGARKSNVTTNNVISQCSEARENFEKTLQDLTGYDEVEE